jgi:hypothetical protein
MISKFMPMFVCTGLLVMLATSEAWGQRGRRPAATDSPLEARLVANKDTYTIPAGQQGEEFAKKVKAEGGTQFPPPEVDLVLELKNPTDKPIVILVDADSGALMLKLEGPGAITTTGQQIFTREFRLGKRVEIPAGKTYEMPIKALKFGFRGLAEHAYWTEPGKYTLGATFRWPDPAGEAGGESKSWQAVAAPIELTVKGAE